MYSESYSRVVSQPFVISQSSIPRYLVFPSQWLLLFNFSRAISRTELALHQKVNIHSFFMFIKNNWTGEVLYVTMKSNNRERDCHCFSPIELSRYVHTATLVACVVQSSLRARKPPSYHSARTYHDPHFHV